MLVRAYGFDIPNRKSIKDFKDRKTNGQRLSKYKVKVLPALYALIDASAF